MYSHNAISGGITPQKFFAPRQVEPTTTRYARMDQIQMGPHPQAKHADHFVPSGGWRPPPHRSPLAWFG